MEDARKPSDMRLGDIVSELCNLTQVKTLATQQSGVLAFTRAPEYIINFEDLYVREKELYSELKKREEIYRPI